MRKKWLLMLIVGIVVSIVLIILKVRHKPPITLVQAKSTESGYLDVAWYDEEVDQIYTVYWSDKPGINIHVPKTYHSKQDVTSTLSACNHSFRIHTRHEYVYFRISKNQNKHKTREFKAKVRLDHSFNLHNLDLRILSRGHLGAFNTKYGDQNDVVQVVQVKVLEDAEQYKVYYYFDNDENVVQTYDTRGMKNVMLKIALKREAMIFLSYVKNGIESEQDFLMYIEKFSPKALKWHTLIKSS